MRGFGRSIAMFAAISAIMNQGGITYTEKQAQIRALTPYQSRGKGGRKQPRTFSGVARSRRAAVKARNKAA
jgi:hypothetical protein